MFKEIFHLLWKTSEKQVNLHFPYSVSSLQLHVQDGNDLWNDTYRKLRRQCTICCHWLWVSVPQLPLQRFSSCLHEMLSARTLQKDPMLGVLTETWRSVGHHLEGKGWREHPAVNMHRIPFQQKRPWQKSSLPTSGLRYNHPTFQSKSNSHTICRRV